MIDLEAIMKKKVGPGNKDFANKVVSHPAQGMVCFRHLWKGVIMGEFSLTHILLVLVVVLIFFGPKRLPDLGKSMGEAIRGFKKGLKDVNSDPTQDVKADAQIPSARNVTDAQFQQQQAQKEKDKV